MTYINRNIEKMKTLVYDHMFFPNINHIFLQNMVFINYFLRFHLLEIRSRLVNIGYLVRDNDVHKLKHWKNDSLCQHVLF